MHMRLCVMDAHAVRKRLSSGRFFPDNSARAEALKEEGNVYFKRRELKEALECYSKAAFLSPWPPTRKQTTILSQLLGHLEQPKHRVAANLFADELVEKGEGQQRDVATSLISLLALCIGNRSAVLHEMNKPRDCLADIEFALSLGFPLVSEYKLYRRRACCLARLRDGAGAVEALETAKSSICSAYTGPRRDKLVLETETYSKTIESLLQEYQQPMSSQRFEEPDRHVHDGVQCSGQMSDLECSSYVSRSVACDSSPNKGRFIKATRPIEPGEVVMSERAYAVVLNFELHLTHCSYCLHKTSSLIPYVQILDPLRCCWCASDGYCSSGCREEAWREYHWLECSISDLWSQADWMLRLALRMVLSAPVNVLQGALSRELDETDSEAYAAIMSLVSHEDEFSDKQQMRMFSKMADIMTECFGDVIESYLNTKQSHQDLKQSPQPTPDDASKRLDSGLRSLFLHHLLQLRFNSHSLTAVVEEEGGGNGGEVVGSSREVQVGSAIFATASLFNHSCWPNIIFRFAGSNVVAVATRPIRDGEEINNCYGPQVGRMKRPERMVELKRKYFFTCSCPACAKSDASLVNRDEVVDAYKCSECGVGAVTRRREDSDLPHWQCRDCSAPPESNEIERVQELVSETERMFGAAQAGGEVDLPLLLKCHKLQSRVLHENNMRLARTTDTVAHAYACSGEFVRAAELCADSCRAVEAVHGSHSIELATELHKLAQLLYNSGQFSEALGIIGKALPLLRVYHPPCHADITELRQMKDQLSTT